MIFTVIIVVIIVIVFIVRAPLRIKKGLFMVECKSSFEMFSSKIVFISDAICGKSRKYDRGQNYFTESVRVHKLFKL